MITESKNSKGTFTLGGTSFACQITAVKISPDHNESGDTVEVLCGDTLGKSKTRSNTLEISAIQDAFDDLAGFCNYTWDNDMKIVPFVWEPNGPSGKQRYTGMVEVLAVELGGDVGKRLETTAKWDISGPVGRGSSGTKGAAAPGALFNAEVTVTASDATNAAKLTALGYIALPTTAWTTGQKITIGTYEFHWSASAWAAGPA